MIDDMLLPPGKTCSDCVNWERCRRFIGSLKPTNTRCDWSPSAFRERSPGVDIDAVHRKDLDVHLTPAQARERGHGWMVDQFTACTACGRSMKAGEATEVVHANGVLSRRHKQCMRGEADPWDAWKPARDIQ